MGIEGPTCKSVCEFVSPLGMSSIVPAGSHPWIVGPWLKKEMADVLRWKGVVGERSRLYPLLDLNQ